MDVTPASENAAPKVGDSFIARGPYSLKAGEITKVTGKTVFFLDESWGKPREKRVPMDSILFVGPQSIAKRLKEQLQSSYAQKIDEQQKASVRQQDRDKKFIAAAVEALKLSPDRSQADASEVAR